MPIKIKLVSFFILITLLPLACANIIFFSTTKESIKNHFLKQQRIEIDRSVQQVELMHTPYLSMTSLLSDLPAIKQLLKSEKSGLDTNSEVRVWVEIFFSHSMQANENITQLRVIDLGGQEVVRVERSRGAISVVDEVKYQNKFDRDYTQETLSLPRGRIHISPIALNVEGGLIETPYKPTIRFSAPVYSDESAVNPIGMIVLNISVQSLLDGLRSSSIGYVIMTDESGNFLIHPNKVKEFSADLKTGFNYLKERPDLYKEIEEREFQNQFDPREKEYRIWRKIYFDPNDISRHWILFSVIEEKVIFEVLDKLLVLVLVLGCVIAFLVFISAIALSESFTVPILKLQRAALQFGSGQMDVRAKVDTEDEISTLAIAFNQMADNLKRNQKELIENAEIIRQNSEFVEHQNEKLTQAKLSLEKMMGDLGQERLKLESAMKQLEFINEELKNFAHIVSHDLKAPLRGIASLASWIKEDHAIQLDEKGQLMLTKMDERIRHLQSLIDGILEYSKVGQGEELITEFDLNVLIRNVVDDLQISNHCKINIQNDLPEMKGDKIRIYQVFQNLISNAARYGDPENGVIDIRYELDSQFYRFSVSDNGNGIAEKHFDRVFQMFQTLENTPGSTGIGLALVKKIVHRYHGRVWIESKLGEGSTFYFTWPQNWKL